MRGTLKAINRSLTIKLKVPQGGREAKFGDIERLRGKRIVGLESLKASQTPFNPDGQAVASEDTFKSSYLTLRSIDSAHEIDSLPLTSFNREDTDGTLTAINYKLIDWVNSEIDCSNTSAATGSATANE